MDGIRITRVESAPEQQTGHLPKAPLYAALGLVILTCVLVAYDALTGAVTDDIDMGEPVAVREIVIEATPTRDLVTVTDPATGAQLAAYAKNEGGFVRGVHRGLSRGRLVAGVSQDHPYRLVRWSTGMMSLLDTETGEQVYLNAFGDNSVKAFAPFLEGQGGS